MSQMLPRFVAETDAPLVITAASEVHGELRTSENVIVNGYIDGLLRARSIHVTPTGEVTGTLVGEIVTVEGQVDDTDIFANIVTLHAGCHVTGRIFCRALEVLEGALFEGSHRRHADPIRLSRVDEPM